MTRPNGRVARGLPSMFGSPPLCYLLTEIIILLNYLCHCAGLYRNFNSTRLSVSSGHHVESPSFVLSCRFRKDDPAVRERGMDVRRRAAHPCGLRFRRPAGFSLCGSMIEPGHEKVLEELQRALPVDSDDEDAAHRRRYPMPSYSDQSASEIWEEHKHRFPAPPTEFDIYERISNLPVTKIKIKGAEIEVRQGGLGMPWFIDRENREKFMGCFEPGSLEALQSTCENSYNRIPFFHDSSHWLPLPGVPASYLPDVRVVEHRTDVEGYEYITVLHDSKRDYTWTYERSTSRRAESFDGRGPLELYELTPSGIHPLLPTSFSKYEVYVPRDYFNVPKDVKRFFPRKPLDTGVFRLPRLDDVMNIKMRNMNRDYALESCRSLAPFGYLQLYQNYWSTVRSREHSSGSVVRYRRLGKSNLVVSDVCLGTMTFGSTVDEETAHGLLDYAFDEFGVNFLDTAELYPFPASSASHGICESIIGRWLQRRGAAVRSELVVATKLASRSPHLSWLRESDCELSKSNILKAVDGCLSRLKTDYIDLLQFHWPDRYVPMHESGEFDQVLFDCDRVGGSPSVAFEEQVDAIRILLEQGKIRHWGLSNETPFGVISFWNLARKAGIVPPASVQLNYNMLCRNDVEKGFAELCRPQNTGIALLAYGPLAGGILTGKYLEYVDTTTAGRLIRFPSYMSRYRGSLAARSVKDYYDIAMNYRFPNLCAMSLRWVYTRPFICSTIIGVNDLYQLRENLNCLNPSLGMTDMLEREINQLHWKWRDPLRICQ